MSVKFALAILFLALFLCFTPSQVSQPSAVSARVATPISADQSLGHPQTKPSRCKRCIQSSLECVEKNDKGDCVKWEEHCTQYETYPC
jgi:hypothetical protein